MRPSLIAMATFTYCIWPKSQMEEFWSPLLKNPKPILIYTGANPVYMPSTQLIERFKATHHMSELDTHSNLPAWDFPGFSMNGLRSSHKFSLGIPSADRVSMLPWVQHRTP